MAFAAGELPPHASEMSAALGFHPLWDASGAKMTASHRERTHARVALTALPEDAAWEGFVAPAVARENARSAEYHGKLVLWGDIAAAGHYAAGGIVLWDGTQFEATPPVSPVVALTVWNDHIVAAVHPSNLST